MDFDICLVCHSQIDYCKLDAAYPHLTEASDFLPPVGMTLLEESIYWGNLCLECAQLAEAEAQGKLRRQVPSPAVIQMAGPAPSPGAAPHPSL